MLDILTTAIVLTRKQGEKSESNYGCAYRGAGDLKCAVGCLIKDEHYYEGLETESADSGSIIEVLNASIGRKLSQIEIGYLVLIQEAHDDATKANFKQDFLERITNYINQGELPGELLCLTK